jgi:hypothetical protein
MMGQTPTGFRTEYARDKNKLLYIITKYEIEKLSFYCAKFASHHSSM